MAFRDFLMDAFVYFKALASDRQSSIVEHSEREPVVKNVQFRGHNTPDFRVQSLSGSLPSPPAEHRAPRLEDAVHEGALEDVRRGLALPRTFRDLVIFGC